MKQNLTLLLILIGLGANAQVQHAKGILSAELDGGLSPYGYYVGAGASYYFGRNIYVKAVANYEHKTKTTNGGLDRVQYSYYLDIPAAYTFYSFNDLVYLNVIGGLTLGYYLEEPIESFELPSSIQYGGLVGGEIEVFVNSKIAVLLNTSSKYIFGKGFGDKRFYYGLGVKYSF